METADNAKIPTLSEALSSIPAPLAKALVEAQKAARAVGKDAANAFHKYKYASAEAIIEEARGALSDAGLALIYLGHEPTQPLMAPFSIYDWINEGGKVSEAMKEEFARAPWPTTPYRVLIRYVLVHESGSTVPFVDNAAVIIEKGRPPDKAESGALTTSLGYVLRGLLLLPRVEEGTDRDQDDDRNHRPGATGRGAQGGQKRQDARQDAQGKKGADAPKQQPNAQQGKPAAQQQPPADPPPAEVLRFGEVLAELAEKGDVDGLVAFIKDTRKHHEKGTPLGDASISAWNHYKPMIEKAKQAATAAQTPPA
jgi:hypothetical protein